MRKTQILCLLIAIVILVSSCASLSRKPGKERAEERVEEYIYVFNHAKDDPGKLWDMLTSSYKERITRNEFIEAYLVDITYPYITPFYIFQPEFSFSEDYMTLTVTFQQAARIVGMTWTVSLVYENGDYYFEDWEYLIDGTYLDKFEDLMYSLDWYYNFE